MKTILPLAAATIMAASTTVNADVADKYSVYDSGITSTSILPFGNLEDGDFDIKMEFTPSFNPNYGCVYIRSRNHEDVETQRVLDCMIKSPNVFEAELARKEASKNNWQKDLPPEMLELIDVQLAQMHADLMSDLAVYRQEGLNEYMNGTSGEKTSETIHRTTDLAMERIRTYQREKRALLDSYRYYLDNFAEEATEKE